MKFRNKLKLLEQKIFRPCPNFDCPLCEYVGPFISTNNRYLGRRHHSQCPECGAKERHRLIAFVLRDLIEKNTTKDWDVLHFAPEKPVRDLIEPVVKKFAASDFNGREELNLDITKIDLPDESFDLVIASHVLEHVANERDALEEIHRILKPGGIAVIPIPIYALKTIEYGKPVECSGHYRAPGPDYFERLRKIFQEVTVISSTEVSEASQPYLLERRSHWPTSGAPYVKPMNGWVFKEYIPICRKR